MASDPVIHFGSMFVSSDVSVQFWLAGFKEAWRVERPNQARRLKPVELIVGHSGPNWPIVERACEDLKPACAVIVSDNEHANAVFETLQRGGYLNFDWPFSAGVHWIVGHVEDGVPMMPSGESHPATDNDAEIAQWLAGRVYHWFTAGEDARARRMGRGTGA